MTGDTVTRTVIGLTVIGLTGPESAASQESCMSHDQHNHNQGHNHSHNHSHSDSQHIP